jgi:hypothetical protein
MAKETVNGRNAFLLAIVALKFERLSLAANYVVVLRSLASERERTDSVSANDVSERCSVNDVVDLANDFCGCQRASAIDLGSATDGVPVSGVDCVNDTDEVESDSDDHRNDVVENVVDSRRSRRTACEATDRVLGHVDPMVSDCCDDCVYLVNAQLDLMRGW